MVNELHCDVCTRDFAKFNSAAQHRNARGHWECEVCTDLYWCQDDADEHMAQYNHYADRHCFDCNRTFRSPNNYQQHRNSIMHRKPQIGCPWCKHKFVTASGLSHHIETGSCPNARNLNREKVFKTLSARDQSGLVTNKLLDYHGDVSYSANERAWNGYGWECYLCHKTFQTLNSLNQHLGSPIHQSRLYHCPSKSCRKEFVSLAALFSHLESESCGYCRFQTVQRSVEGILTSNRTLTFH